ncbi:MAG: DUF2283 domain-containing protein [Bacteroidota bacterium]
MKIYYQPKHDLLHITFRESKQIRNERYNDDIVFDVDGNGKVVGMEILDATEYLNLEDLLSVTLIQEKAA